jgi:hypothetical protein
MIRLSPERIAAKIADEFIAAEFDDEAEASAWLAEKIKAALDAAEEAGYRRAMAKRF